MNDEIKRRKDERQEPWRMPEWMESYRELITGNGEPVETLINDSTPYQVNGPRAIIAASTKTQVGLLERLHARGLLHE